MKITQTMLGILQEIRQIEPRRRVRALNVPVSQIGNQLINYYYGTSNLETRQLIREFMEEAGFVWTKKLITRDTLPVEAAIQFAGLQEYVELAAANDPAVNLTNIAS